MANSPPSSSPRGDEVRDANGDEHQETELFEDTLVVHSPLIETEVQNLDLNTEVQNLDLNAEYVEDSEPVESMTLITAATCDNEPEVVLDSEDEEMNNAGKVTVAERFLENGSSPVGNNSLVLFKKKLPKLPCEQANSKSNAATSGKFGTGDERASIDAEPERFDDNNHRLYDVRSPEPGDSTVAALGFVDQYLSSIDVDMFQGFQNGKITREKSPNVSSARGSISLAKKIKARTQNEDKDPYEWDDSVQNEKEAGIFRKQLEACFNVGSHGLAYKRRQKKGSHPPNQGKCSASNRCDENLVQETIMEADNNNYLKELDVESCATRENVDIYSSVARTEDVYDIGLDTQIAAEAMDALANLSPADFHLSDVHQQENAFDASLNDLKQAHQKNSPSKENPGSHSIDLKSYKRNVSSRRFSKVTSSSSCKDTNNQESNPVSGKMKKTMGSKSTVEGQFKNNASPSICDEHVSHEEVCLPGEDTSFQSASKEPKIHNKRKWTRLKRQPSHLRERNNNVEEGSVRYKRKGNCLVADSVKIDVKAKRLNSSIRSYGVARKSSLKHQVEVSPQQTATSCFSKIDSWAYPKGPRGKRKRANAPRFLCIDDKENNVYSTKILEGQDDVHKSCLPPVSAGDAIKFENLHNMQPLLLAHVEILSNKSVVQSSSEISASVVPIEGIKISNANHTSNEQRKKACDKNLPKSSLLKELIRLGVPKSTSEMMSKDPRHRRDMTNVRVLFSQHLDDIVLKQQQKILTRLNISTASSSMEATHFIADKFTRTKNMLETMALGNLVLTHLWLESCGQANCFIDEKNYILRDMKKEKEIGFSMPVSLARARQKPLLKGKRVYITPNIKPNKEVVTSLVTAVHGQLVDENQIFAEKNDNVLDDLLILSCEEDFAICRHFLKRGAAVYSSELVLNGIVIQKLELERHKLFVNQVEKNKLGRCNWFGKVYRRRLMPLS
ncbi:hypothetical protein TSUD_341480 [Trifolium subterraneum]|uniref:BRCT domain-containing protein n=1 Tax=Trifolium subterraneum TaxID=3900 RepID=A0A2Z6M6Q3_TRISU|nr:hypothetical protein TSUD_341480 [Trifolium subterraneum]